MFDRAFDAFWREHGHRLGQASMRPADGPGAHPATGNQAHVESLGVAVDENLSRGVVRRPADLE